MLKVLEHMIIADIQNTPQFFLSLCSLFSLGLCLLFFMLGDWLLFYCQIYLYKVIIVYSLNSFEVDFNFLSTYEGKFYTGSGG